MTDTSDAARIAADRDRAALMGADFCRYLIREHKMDHRAVASALVLVGATILTVRPTSPVDMALARSLADQLQLILDPVLDEEVRH